MYVNISFCKLWIGRQIIRQLFANLETDVKKKHEGDNGL